MRNNIELCDIWIIQEHWLYPNTIVKFAGLNFTYDYIANSGINDRDIVNCGKPKGGLKMSLNQL